MTHITNVATLKRPVDISRHGQQTDSCSDDRLVRNSACWTKPATWSQRGGGLAERKPGDSQVLRTKSYYCYSLMSTVQVPFLFVSNNSKDPVSKLVQKLDDAGLKVNAKEIFTSLTAAKHLGKCSMPVDYHNS